ncbi:MAG TPA: hypothetical protein DEP72_05305 [Clostridiales bacterium]|nr:MAG: hypothetical protein A2Y18_08540 [Clostridiales bacterium GWD2_32_19]HCC07559.1 hypothetical protein [Clostridiales bacterium]
MSQNGRHRHHSNIADLLEDSQGETVTILTECGGKCGNGFTGVVIKVSHCLVKLVTSIGPSPSGVFGTSRRRGLCDGFNDFDGCGKFDRFDRFDRFDDFDDFGDVRGSFSPRNRKNNLGSVVTIPIDKICAVIRNAV